jgi:hypothetical protein
VVFPGARVQTGGRQATVKGKSRIWHHGDTSIPGGSKTRIAWEISFVKFSGSRTRGHRVAFARKAPIPPVVVLFVAGFLPIFVEVVLDDLPVLHGLAERHLLVIRPFLGFGCTRSHPETRCPLNSSRWTRSRDRAPPARDVGPGRGSGGLVDDLDRASTDRGRAGEQAEPLGLGEQAGPRPARASTDRRAVGPRPARPGQWASVSRSSPRPSIASPSPPPCGDPVADPIDRRDKQICVLTFYTVFCIVRT